MQTDCRNRAPKPLIWRETRAQPGPHKAHVSASSVHRLGSTRFPELHIWNNGEQEHRAEAQISCKSLFARLWLWRSLRREAARSQGGAALPLDLFDFGLGGGDDALGQNGEELLGRGVAIDRKHFAGAPQVSGQGGGGGAGE